MKIEKYSDFDMMAIEVAQRIAGDLTGALHNADRAMLAVPGGTTPGPIFDDLCAADLDWSRVDVVLTDERWVPGDHPRSLRRLHLHAALRLGPPARHSPGSGQRRRREPEGGGVARAPHARMGSHLRVTVGCRR